MGAGKLSIVNVQLFLLCTVGFAVVCAERNASCVTPNGETATCVSARTCEVIAKAILTRNSSAIEFAKQSQCGYDTEPLLCCGSSAYHNLQEVFVFPMPTEVTTAIPNTQQELILVDYQTTALPDRTICGIERVSFRVLGGHLTGIDEFPWMAALEYQVKTTGENAGIRCGGSVINNRYILTAAHCILHKEFELISVWLGEWQISTDPDCLKPVGFGECADSVQKIKIKKKIPHPFYSIKFWNNDIGLLELEHDIKFTDYIRPICLPPASLPSPAVNSSMTVAGWGTMENHTTSDYKLKVEIPLVSSSDCNKMLNKQIGSNQLCAGGEPGKDACDGDSGGPLMRMYGDRRNQQTQWYQEGVVSLGIGCGRVGYPAIYTRVSRYVNWIITNISGDIE